MSNKKSKPTKKSNTKKSNKQTQKNQQNSTIQWIAAGAIILVLAVIIWVVVANRKPGSQGESPAKVGNKQYAEAPPMSIDVNKQYLATVKMANGGEFVIELFPDKAPLTVNSFVFLAREGYFDGVTFHRVLEDFMAQTGDPTGTGTGGPGYTFVNEDSDLKFDKAGVVAMANAGRDTNGSQFFITFGPAEYLNGGYTIFGQVTSGMEVVNAITLRNPQENPGFTGDAIESITIEEK